jgi:predicted RNA-binding Zn-ribbon protein involved in translation (DUF1610 family)
VEPVKDAPDEMQLSAIETILVVGVIACLLLATWEVAHLAVDEWLRDWVGVNPFLRKRIIYYGIAFSMSVSTVAVTSVYAFEFGRFGKTINRALLWYGTLLLISTITVFVFDCVPEVVAGFLGAAVFALAIYAVQTRYFTAERTIRTRLEKGRCFSCGARLRPSALFCPACGVEVGTRCAACRAFTRRTDKFCSHCRSELA